MFVESEKENEEFTLSNIPKRIFEYLLLRDWLDPRRCYNAAQRGGLFERSAQALAYGNLLSCATSALVAWDESDTERWWALELEFLLGYDRPFGLFAGIATASWKTDINRWPKFHACNRGSECVLLQRQHDAIAKLNAWTRFLVGECTPLTAGPRHVVCQYAALFHYHEHDTDNPVFLQTKTTPYPCGGTWNGTDFYHPVCAAVAKECQTDFC